MNDFSIYNLPYGVFEAGRGPRVGVAFEDSVVDLAEAAALGYFRNVHFPDLSVFSRPSLNAFIALGRPYWQAVRNRVAELILDPRLLVDLKSVKMLFPVEIGDFVDFYSSKEHATNVGKMFRPDNPLMLNWTHLPVGYNGRTSSIIMSGQNIHRPKGQINPSGKPELGPTQQLDFELELGFIVGRNTPLGSSVSVLNAEDCIFGLVLLNDWSARDIQRWEYVPLGPFLGKSFATSISPWVVTLDALDPFRVAGPEQDPAPLPYLRAHGARNFAIDLEVWLQPASEAEPMRVCATNFGGMYWNMCQQLAHLTTNGTNLRVGDLCGSGTVSGPEPGSFGSMLEICWNGTRPLTFPGGAVRRFLEDGDTVILRGFAERDGVRIGFGDLTTKILPAL